MKITTAISPCPNDTYIFDAILNKKIDTKNYEFISHYADVEELNKTARDSIADITKLSFFAYFNLADKYQLLNSGSALGKNCGPLLVSKYKIYPDEIKNVKIAIPGINTTAFLLMNILFKDNSKSLDYKEFLFSDIEEVVLSNECDAGLIIHESRFSYLQKGLKLISDLGELWEEKFSLPIPLGGIAVKRNLSQKIKNDIDKIIQESVHFAMSNPNSSLDYIKKYSTVKDDEVINKHINLYVNKYSLKLDNLSKKSIMKLYEQSKKLGFVSGDISDIFV